jgi:hypothetical protein
MKLTEAQRYGLTAGDWYRSRYGDGRLVTSGGSGRYSTINVRTMRKLRDYGLVELSEGYSRQDGGNVWTATMTEAGEAMAERIRQDGA